MPYAGRLAQNTHLHWHEPDDKKGGRQSLRTGADVMAVPTESLHHRPAPSHSL